MNSDRRMDLALESLHHLTMVCYSVIHATLYNKSKKTHMANNHTTLIQSVVAYEWAS